MAGQLLALSFLGTRRISSGANQFQAQAFPPVDPRLQQICESGGPVGARRRLSRQGMLIRPVEDTVTVMVRPLDEWVIV